MMVEVLKAKINLRINDEELEGLSENAGVWIVRPSQKIVIGGRFPG